MVPLASFFATSSLEQAEGFAVHCRGHEERLSRSMPSPPVTKLAVSPAVIVRFRPDGIRLQSAGHSSRGLSSEHTDVLDVLSLFAVPREPAEVAELLPPERRAAFDKAVQQLHAAGLLAGAEGEDRGARPPDPLRRAQEILAELGNAAYSLASDLNGFGAAIFEILPAERDPLSRLGAALAAVEEVAGDLRARRGEWLAAHLRDLGVSEEDRHLKLHVGSGEHHLAGWVNIDVAPAPLPMNVKWGLPFAEGAADYAYLSHFLEHLFYPAEAFSVLSDLFRVLAPGGVLRVVVPDIEKCLRAYVEEDEVFFQSRRETWTWWPKAATRLQDFLAYAGAGPSPGRLFDAHKFGYDFETLAHLLRRVGFQTVERSEYMESDVLRIDDASRVAGARFGDRYYSLFVDATR
jgi:predicted SAM-dependent methyltransferase